MLHKDNVEQLILASPIVAVPLHLLVYLTLAVLLRLFVFLVIAVREAQTLAFLIAVVREAQTPVFLIAAVQGAQMLAFLTVVVLVLLMPVFLIAAVPQQTHANLIVVVQVLQVKDRQGQEHAQVALAPTLAPVPPSQDFQMFPHVQQ